MKSKAIALMRSKVDLVIPRLKGRKGEAITHHY